MNQPYLALATVDSYAVKWKIQLNDQKIEAILFNTKRPNHNFLVFGGKQIPFRQTVTYLGVTFDRQLTLEHHTKHRKKIAEEWLKALTDTWRLRDANNVARRAAVYGQAVWMTGTFKAAHTITMA